MVREYKNDVLITLPLERVHAIVVNQRPGRGYKNHINNIEQKTGRGLFKRLNSLSTSFPRIYIKVARRKAREDDGWGWTARLD